MLQSEKSSELFYIHLSILSRAYCTQLYLWLSSQRQYKSQKSVQLGSVLNFCRFQQLSKYYQVKRRGINRLSVTSSAELNWIRIKECNRFSTLNNLYCYTNLTSYYIWIDVIWISNGLEPTVVLLSQYIYNTTHEMGLFQNCTKITPL